MGKEVIPGYTINERHYGSVVLHVGTVCLSIVLSSGDH